ncbi:MAG: transporter related [Bacteriovoracaceae bacterium]|nr:transporter related [Bacteriovoracaceae bacterium]
MSVVLNQLETSLGDFRLGPLSAEFSDVGLHLIRGKNGAGKTTLLRTLLGRLRKTAGTIVGLQFPIGVIGVEPLLIGSWTVTENAKWLSQLLQKSSSVIPSELSHLALQRVDHLSQGLKRQVELSLLLSFNLPTLFLDEPLSPLDRAQREFYAEKVKKAAAKSFVLMTTHFEEDLFGKPIQVLEL